ncbi:MAG TPA: hypothetical protein VMR95_02620 [Candidatus Binatia bacterium]|nr:hypothetical protein [Candidatus Binatia bacterium]
MNMDVWGWTSPIAWALFLVGCGTTLLLLAWSIRMLSSIPLPTSLSVSKKK